MRVFETRIGGISKLAAAAVALGLCLGSLQCSKSPTEPTGSTPPSPTVPGPTPNPIPVPSGPQVFVGAGDIAICGNGDSEGTARIIDGIGGQVFTLGDNAYPQGSPENFQNCYNPTWGRLRARTRPAPGNHDYGDTALPTRRPLAGPYFDYFGEAAGPYGLGYYSYDVGAWHIISLNSNSDFGRPDGIDVSAGSAQAAWLRADLAANKTKCTLAYWHHPLFSSGQNGDNPRMQAFFRILYDADADVVLNGHDHLYERFAPQDADGRNDPARGIRQFIVGTGGTVPLYDFVTTKPNSEVRLSHLYGVIKMTLNADSYQWEFITTTSGTRDSGSGTCH